MGWIFDLLQYIMKELMISIPTSQIFQRKNLPEAMWHLCMRHDGISRTFFGR